MLYFIHVLIVYFILFMYLSNCLLNLYFLLLILHLFYIYFSNSLLRIIFVE